MQCSPAPSDKFLFQRPWPPPRSQSRPCEGGGYQQLFFPINSFLLRENVAGHVPVEEQVQWYRGIFAALHFGGQVLVVSNNGVHRSFGGGPPVTLFSRRPPDDCCGSAGGGGGLASRACL